MKRDLRNAQLSQKRRRTIAALAALVGAPLSVLATNVTAQGAPPRKKTLMSNNSSFHVTKDGTRIFFKDWGEGTPIVFSHGWPLDADAWDSQMLFLGLRGYRVIAHDRRAHGRSTQTWDNNDMNTYADDLSGLLDMLDVKDAMLVGHSTGGGEVVRYLGRHGTKRISKAVLIGAIPPVMLKSASNPGGLSIDVFDNIRAGVLQRAQYYKDLAMPFYGYNRQGATPVQGVIDEFWLEGMRGGIKGQYDCVKQFSETDFTQDLQRIKIPTLLLHGDDDQIVPISDSAALSSKLLSNATLKVYQGAPHGMCTTLSDKVNADLLAFARS
ncbi:Chloride peroxidase [Paraburkholderia phytofirmans PsJN]|uniref:Chloride peroxidase n=2 Tax=Paraburkholderia phytofirmans TaxID=261302 RepID=B2T1H2_PARPJ|nr:Chloride peroxidase [Paraburkholderia phytofirmans PsJN]